MHPAASSAPPVLVADRLAFGHAGLPLFDGLSFTLGPGLHLVRGGDGRGKSTLMRLLAGSMVPTGGTLQRHAATVYLADPAQPSGALADDQAVAEAALAAAVAACPAGQPERIAPLVQALGLAPHVHKPIYMLSTGSRRKLGVVAAVASGAALTLIDAPYAALDTASVRAVDALLAEAAGDARRAWVVADHEAPRGLAGVRWAGIIDLGD